jgi:hypothetical protein
LDRDQRTQCRSSEFLELVDYSRRRRQQLALATILDTNGVGVLGTRHLAGVNRIGANSVTSVDFRFT